jgi:hypothetical protein
LAGVKVILRSRSLDPAAADDAVAHVADGGLAGADRALRLEEFEPGAVAGERMQHGAHFGIIVADLRGDLDRAG